MRRDSQVVREVPEMRKTTVRRGLGKLSVLSESSRSIIYQNYKKQRIPSDALPDYAFRLNFSVKQLVELFGLNQVMKSEM